MPILKVHIKEKEFPYNGNSLHVLNNISFEVGHNEFVSIIGPSGCGKTTLLKIILGLETEYNGEVWMNGKRIIEPGLDRGMVFQDHRLLPWFSVEENIGFALPDKRKNDERITSVVQKVGLNGFEKALPRQLSGGMAQRVALARAIVNVPDLLLLDEAFGSLDDFTRNKMQVELQRIISQSNTTTIMVTHNIDEAVLLSNRIIVFSDKPATIVDVIEIDMEQPRNKLSAEFIRYRNQLIMEL
jgi:sulfonate transport system ATP-binding protein